MLKEGYKAPHCASDAHSVGTEETITVINLSKGTQLCEADKPCSRKRFSIERKEMLDI